MVSILTIKSYFVPCFYNLSYTKLQDNNQNKYYRFLLLEYLIDYNNIRCDDNINSQANLRPWHDIKLHLAVLRLISLLGKSAGVYNTIPIHFPMGAGQWSSTHVNSLEKIKLHPGKRVLHTNK